MPKYFIPLTFVLLVLSSSVSADLSRWVIQGASARACTETTGGSCVTLTCGANENIVFSVNGAGLQGGRGTISVDGQLLGTGTFQGGSTGTQVVLNPVSNASIFTAISQGARLRTEIQGRTIDLSLSGSAAAVSAVVSQCSGQPPAVSETNNSTELIFRSENESEVAYENGLRFGSFSKHPGLDIWGGDIRSGLTDPALRGISQDECAQLCLVSRGCGAFTHNAADGDVCFLKTGGAAMSPYAGATTGVRAVESVELPAPPTRGLLPVVNESVAWGVQTSPAEHYLQTRDASKGLGLDCNQEQAILEALRRDFTFEVEGAETRVGQLKTVSWTGNSLVERVPVWFMVSSTSPIRFDGLGAMVLGPDAPSPFGIQASVGETRAMVSLWGRGAGRSGKLNVQPLLAGSMDLTVSLVAYLRDCGQEMVLDTQTIPLGVAPAAATLVLGTPAGRADLTHQFDIEQFGRRVEFSDTRLRLSSLSDGTEIIERDGTQLRLSPTERFILVDGYEVIDVVDGATVGRVDYASFWGVGDSFMFGNTSPWAEVDVLSTFGSRLIVDDQITGPSCCSATPEATHISIDIENGLIALRGTLGHSIGPLQGSVLSREDGGSGYNSSSRWIAETQEAVTYSLAPVAPITVANRFSIPGIVPIGDLLAERATLIPKTTIGEDIVVASLFRGTGIEAVSAFERIGIYLAQGEQAVDIMTPVVIPADYLDRGITPPGNDIEGLEERLNEITALVGWDVDLVPAPSGNFNASDCFHYISTADASEAEFTNQTVFGRPDAVLLPEEIQQLLVLGEGDGALLGFKHQVQRLI